MTFEVMYDYDDVVVGMVPALHRKAHEMGFHDNTQEALATWHGDQQYGITQELWWSVFDELMAEGWYYNTPAIPGVVEGMHKLKERGHRIHILTARGFMKHAEEIRRATYKNIEMLELPVDTITFDKDKPRGMASALRDRWQYAGGKVISPKFDYALDDGSHNYEDLDNVGVNVYLQELPHNEEWRRQNPNARTVASADAFVDLILKES